MASILHYGIIKYNIKEDTFIIIDSCKTMIYDSRVGFLDIKALCLKEELSNEKINKAIAYMKQLLINATDRNIINRDNYEFCFNELLASRGIPIQNDVLTKETVNAHWLKCVSTFFGIICSAITI